MELKETSSSHHRVRIKDDEEDRNSKGLSCTAFFVFVSHSILVRIERVLEAIGTAIVRRGLIAFLVSLVVLGLLCLGYIRVQRTEWPPGIFECKDNQARKDLQAAAKTFATLDTWKTRIAYSDVNILKTNCLDRASGLRDRIEDMESFKRACAECKPTSASVLNGVTAQQIWIMTARQQNTTFTQNIVRLDYTMSLTDVKVSLDVTTKQFHVTAKGLLLTFYLKRPEDNRGRNKIYLFEEELSSAIKNISASSQCSTVVAMNKNEEDQVWHTVSPNTSYLLYSLPVLIFIAFLFAFMVDRSVLTVLALLCVTLITAICVVVAFGVFSMFAVPYHDIYLLIPFFVYCTGLINCLLLVTNLNTVQHWSSLNRRIANCMTKAGFLITVSAFVVIIIVGISAWSCFPAINRFFGLMFLTVFLMYVTTFVTLVPVLVWYTSKPRGSPGRRISMANQSLLKQDRHFSTMWINVITSFVGKLVLILIFAVILAGCIYVVVTQPSKIDNHTIASFYKDSQASTILSEREDVSLILKGQVNYKDSKVMKDLADLSITLSKQSYSAGRASFFMSSFKEWSSTKTRSCNGNQYDNCLQAFLNEPLTSLYKRDEKVDNNITYARLHLPVRTRLQGTKKALEDIRKDVDKTSFKNVITVVSDAFPAVKNVQLFRDGQLNTIILALVIVILILFLMTASLRTPILLLLTFIMLTLELVTLMYLFKIPLNQLSFICGFPVLVIAFSFSVYVSQAFIISKVGSEKGKTIEAVASTVGPVLSGASFLLLCSVALGIGFEHLAVIFQRVIPTFVELSILHAFAFIPLILSTYGKLRRRLGLSKLQIPFAQQRRFTAVVGPDNTEIPEHDKSPTISERQHVALIGIACRFPTAPSKDEFWKMLQQGRCAVSTFPENRNYQYKQFHAVYNPKRFVSGRICTVGGSFMESIKGFDAAFFKISQQEANSMDPQQRILLEVVYEAIEDSGMRLEDLQACRTGVYVGVMNLDYGSLVIDDEKTMDQFVATGITGSIVSNRISFCFNFTGPSFTVDTACSSSMTALKLAIDSLQNGDCEAAIVCAPNIILSHIMHMTSSLAGLLAPDGRCKSFDASGDGYGRGEGFAAVILKLTETAINDGDDIYCEIVSCGLNNDGADTTPMTAPSSRSQANLFRTVLQKSGLRATDIDYLEAHGTGTAIGDVVETTSISDAYCDSVGEEGRVLRIGSVKSNINHTESTSGLAGLIKLALMIKNESFVPTVNVHTLNPRLKLADKGLMVQTVTERWQRRKGKLRIGAVSSYGFGGSNAHAIVREVVLPPKESPSPITQNSTHVMTMSARSKESLHSAATALTKWLAGNKDLQGRLDDICYSLNERRTVHPHRLALAFESPEEAIKLLNDFGSESKDWQKKITYGVIMEESQKLVFMFGGQGPQWYGMGRQLIENEPTFMSTIIEISRLLKTMGEKWDLLEELIADESDSKLNELIIGQTATFALQYSIARLLMSWGIYPSAVIGHSLGEFAAASISGALSLKDALNVVLLRAKLQTKCPSNGAMAALGMSEYEATSLLIDLKLEATVSVAAVNDAKSVTLSGDAESIEAFGDYLTVNNVKVFWRVLNTPRAFHSAHMAPIEKSFTLAGLRQPVHPKDTAISFYSTVDGEVVPGKELSHSYWWRNIRQPVQFCQAMRSLLRDGFRSIIEIGAQPTLAHYVKQITTQEGLADDKPFVMATLPRRKVQEQHKAFMQNTVCELFASGYPVQLSRVSQYGERRKFIRPPTYSWQEKECWYRSNEPEKEVLPHRDDTKTSSSESHPFLGKTVRTKPFSGLTCWETEIDLHRLPYLKDHALTQGGAIMPGVTYLEMAFAMAKEGFMCSSVELSNVKLLSLLTLPEGQIRNLRLRLMRSSVGEANYQITSIQEDQSELLMSSGNMRCDSEKQVAGERGQEELEAVGDEVKALMGRMKVLPVEEFQDLTKRFGFSYGPAFSVMKRIWKGNNEGLCLMQLDESLAKDEHKYIVHPSLLDACLQSCFVPISEVELSNKSIVPVGWESVSLVCSRVPKQILCHVKSDPEKWGHFDITQMSLSGQPILSMKGFRIAELNLSGKTDEATLDEISYNVTWVEADFPTPKSDEIREAVCLVLKDSKGFASAFIKEIKDKGAEVIALDVSKARDFSTEAEEQQVRDHFHEALRKCESSDRKLIIVNFWLLETILFPEHFDVIDKAQNISLRSSLFLMKLLFDNPELEDAQVVMVSQNTQYGVTEDSAKEGSIPWSSIVWGMRRTAALETQTLRIRAVDLSLDSTGQEISQLINELALDNVEEEVAFRNGKRYVNRYVRLSKDDVIKEVSSCIKQDEPKSFYLVKGSNKTSIALKSNTQSKILTDEVEVQLSHVFSSKEQICDFTEDAGCVAFSGTVISAGSTSSNFKPNDKVSGIVRPRRIGKHIRVSESQLMLQPEGFTEAQAASHPFCAALAFKVLERANIGKRQGMVLVHEADKAVGFTAAALAKAMGQKIICTIAPTGSRDVKKRLLDLGAEDVVDISCLDLSDKYDGKCDTVLFMSSPRPGALQRSYATLKTNGRLVVACDGFNGQVVLPGSKSISYDRINAMEVMNEAESMEGMWKACLPLLTATGILAKLRNMKQEVNGIFAAIEDWNSSQESKYCAPVKTPGFFNTFKFDDKDRPQILLPGIDNFGLKGNRTYMVAGGVRGFGFEIACWMAKSGAHTIVLLGRSAPNEEKKKEVRELEQATGARIMIEQVDLSNEEHMKSLEVKLKDLPSMAGIVLTAMVLRDNLISLMELNSFRDVLAPKVKGAFLLHKMSLHMDLDFFVMFSSLSSVIGNTGQASYAAGNAFQDALAAYRRHVLGLPGLAVNWGPIGGAGVMTRERNIVDLLAIAGFDLLDAKEGAKFMAEVMACQPSRCQVSFTEMRWATHLKQNPNLARSTRVESLKTEADTSDQQSGAVSSLGSKILLERDSSKRTVLIEEFVYTTLGYWAGVENLSEADKTTSLYSFGVDSTAALTLKMSFESSLDVSFEVFYFMQPDTTAAKIVTDLQELLCEPVSSPEAVQEADDSTESIPDEEKETLPRPRRSTKTNKRSAKALKQSVKRRHKGENGLAHKAITSCKVIPIYTPEKAEIKFFCIHPSHRYAMSVAPFATGFKFQELVSMYAIGFTEPTEREAWDSVRQLALQYIDLIRGEQRHGPYFLGGYSFGGLVAYEMANILIEKNERVEFVVMIDTYAWLPASGGFGRLASWFSTGFSPEKQVEVQFEEYLTRLAVKSLKMTESQCLSLRTEHSILDMMDHLQQRSRDLEVPLYDLKAMWESLLHDQVVASRTHDTWEPPEVQYEGPVTYIRSENPKFSPTLPQYKSSDKAWAEVVIGPMDVCICPGHHFSLSELPYARVVGNILANSISIRYRTIFPELYRFALDYKQRRAVRRFQTGMSVVLYPNQERKVSKSGKLFLDHENQEMRFIQQDHLNKNPLQGKTIVMKDVRSILPGKYVRNAIKQWTKRKKLRNGKHCNLTNVVTVIGQRMYNFEFATIDDVQTFVHLVEGIYNVKVIHPF